MPEQLSLIGMANMGLHSAPFFFHEPRDTSRLLVGQERVEDKRDGEETF